MKYLLVALVLLALFLWQISANKDAEILSRRERKEIHKYYEDVKGLTGQGLKTALHKLIRNHKVYPYFSDSIGVGEMMMVLDEDPANTDNIILFYTGRSQLKEFTDLGNRFDYKSEFNSIHENSWNREHIWPKSHGFPNMTDTAYTDIHHLRPADRSVNGDRGTRDFDWGGFRHREAEDCFSDFDSWEPRDEIKGDIARMMFYMAVRYEGKNSPYDLELVDFTNTSGQVMGNLNTLLEWHKFDPVSTEEIKRNQKIFELYQRNRNPFIDFPEFAKEIWGEPDTSPQINISEPFMKFPETQENSSSDIFQYVVTVCNLKKNSGQVAEVKVTSELPFEISADGRKFGNELILTSLDYRINDAISIRFKPDRNEFYQSILKISTSGVSDSLEMMGYGLKRGSEVLDYESFEYVFGNWSTYSLAGNKDWETSSYGDRRFAKISGYKADEACDDWLILSELNVSEYNELVFSFETAKNHKDIINGLRFLVSTDYRKDKDPSQSKWQEISADYSDGKYSWKHSGYIAYPVKSRSISLAFHYENSSPKSATTWEVDDIKIIGTKKK
ncbi:MAG: endonuclease [Candidatus Cloacimonetes bacterium]|nr:endonuclease [Candidatus Cloacimonadota bacterium]